MADLAGRGGCGGVADRGRRRNVSGRGSRFGGVGMSNLRRSKFALHLAFSTHPP